MQLSRSNRANILSGLEGEQSAELARYLQQHLPKVKQRAKEERARRPSFPPGSNEAAVAEENIIERVRIEALAWTPMKTPEEMLALRAAREEERFEKQAEKTAQAIDRKR